MKLLWTDHLSDLLVTQTNLYALQCMRKNPNLPQPVMEVNVKRTKLDERSTSHDGVRCTLYEAQKQQGYDKNFEHNFKTKLAEIDANMGFAQMLSNEKAEVLITKFGRSPVGSSLSYQAAFSGSNFSEPDLIAVNRNIPVTNITNYSHFPLSNEADMVLPQLLTDAEILLVAT